MPLFTNRSGRSQESPPEPPPITGPDGITLRRLETIEEYEDAVALQDEIWGAGFSDRVPAAILRVAQKVGGVSAGAFDESGRMLGFVFGLTGVRTGRLVHWSDMLAVREDARGRHLGDRLKYYQRDLVRAIGVETMLWTFDPLVARNAHFNLNRLGARVAEYVPNLYGSNTGSVLHGGLPTDRFIAEWDLTAPRHTPKNGVPPSAASAAADSPVVNVSSGEQVGLIDPLPATPRVRVQVPHDIELVHALGADTALAWRLATRDAFLHYLGRGYRVARFDRGDGIVLPAYELEYNPPPIG
jgi:predicted GNAT superfamily acetyltransferase